MPDSWTWAGGSDTAGGTGIYGTAAIAAPTNIPGARYAGASWTDAYGNFWMFGGQGTDAASNPTVLSDLWKYSGGLWSWEGGSNTINARGSYGTRGVAAPGNMPGARYAAVNWTDPSGDVWVFGGQGIDAAGNSGALNDLWKYSNGQWTWMAGSDTSNAPAVPGSKGTALATNIPGARFAANCWTDAAGNFWLFGGLGFDSSGNQGFLNDLWEFSAGKWIWISGPDAVNTPGVYGANGVADAANIPGSRLRAIAWIDASGQLWFFGGLGFDSTGQQGSLNDVWRYAAGEWTWMGVSNTTNATGKYGSRGAGAATNIPGARYAANSWTDFSGNVWLLGGVGNDSSGNQFGYNDLWKFHNGQWTWVTGSQSVNAVGAYGTLGVASAGNSPGARYAGAAWTNTAGHLWLFGGQGFAATATAGLLSDLWEYAP